MAFVSIVPNIRTPLGVDEFDYLIDDKSDLRAGDLILVPFRRKHILGLVTSVMSESAFANKAVRLVDPKPILRLPPTIVPLLRHASLRTFTSRPTILHSWLRRAPARLQAADPDKSTFDKSTEGRSADITEFTATRVERILFHAKESRGRVLVLSPWQRRADALGAALSAPVLHAETPMKQAWDRWTSFVQEQNSILVTTRVGSWLAAVADTVILDEPENDDWKQDELSPRIDTRWLLETANLYKPSLCIIRIGTTPQLADPFEIKPLAIPKIELKQDYVAWDWKGKSEVDSLQEKALERIEEAIEEKRPVIILHPIKGDSSRLQCRGCRWQAACSECKNTLSQVESRGLCRRCGALADLPLQCPTCGSTDLSSGRTGKNRLAFRIKQKFGTAAEVRDLQDWNATSIPRGALVVVTDISLIGGIGEDIRKRERLLISWRRMASAIASADGQVVAQGQEELIAEVSLWLTAEGVVSCWKSEWDERKSFGYPPATQRIKLLFNGTDNESRPFAEQLQKDTPSSWIVSGPFPVPYRSRTRSERQVFHIQPPADTKESQLQTHLEPFAKNCIIDLDPISFFM